MTGKEKLYFFLNRIEDKKVLTPKGQPILIHPAGDLNSHYPQAELIQLLHKLEEDEKILRVVRTPTVSEWGGLGGYENGYYGIEILPTFDDYYFKIQQESEYQEFTGNKPLVQKTQNKERPNRKGLEKIWNILQEIDEINQISSSNGKLKIPHEPRGFTGSPQELSPLFNDRETVLKKLLSLKAIDDLESEETFGSFWHFKIGGDFNKVFDEYKEKYKAIAKEYEQTKTTKEIEEKIDAKDIAYEVKYSEKSREVLINNFLLAKPDFNSENEVVFSYLYQNANRTVKTAELEKQVGDKLKKPIHNILRDLGFTGKLAKAFFSASKNGVMFRNPITYQDLKDLGIERIKIQENK